MSTKKILAVLLALFVLATAVSGCGNSGSSSADSQSGSSATSENSASTEDTASTDGEVPTISLMVVCGTTPPDADAVAEKLSEITREKIGCNVEFITMEIGNVAQQLNLLLVCHLRQPVFQAELAVFHTARIEKLLYGISTHRDPFRELLLSRILLHYMPILEADAQLLEMLPGLLACRTLRIFYKQHSKFPL